MSATLQELRYGFGKNWADYIRKNLSDEAVERSRAHLAEFLRVDSLQGLTFLDIGCGSGLHSLAAHRLGAERIISFDYDPDSVATTEQVRQYAGNPPNWTVVQGSVLDRTFMEKVPKTDIVYSWGVLHHTGDMWGAVRNAAIPMKPDAVFCIALYSSDIYLNPPPQYWIELRRRYNLSGPLRKRIMEWQYALQFSFMPALRAGRNPVKEIRAYVGRGMAFWTDVKDWLGGYPMDFAGLRETRDFCRRELRLDLVNVKAGEGNTEYLFCRLSQNSKWHSIDQQRERHLLPGPFTAYRGATYAASIPELASQADSSDAPRRSQLMLYEDGGLLGLSHSIHDYISQYGNGRFSHWGDYLYFSTSDNSDPNSNGRRYEYCEKF
jgi:SAM-dependent methyltransferase